jgi:hypothetical protein
MVLMLHKAEAQEESAEQIAISYICPQYQAANPG